MILNWVPQLPQNSHGLLGRITHRGPDLSPSPSSPTLIQHGLSAALKVNTELTVQHLQDVLEARPHARTTEGEVNVG